MRLDFQSLSWQEFEDLVRDLLREDGYTIEYQAGVGPDSGSDLIVSRKLSTDIEILNRKYVVQCKHSERTVNRGRISSIENLLLSKGANGYILVVSSRVSNPLMEMLVRISENSNYKCKVFQRSDVHDLLLKHPQILRKWFPEMYNEIYSDTDFTATHVITIAKADLDLELTEDEAERLSKWAILFSVKDEVSFSKVLHNKEVIQLVNRLFEEKLSRPPLPFETVMYAIRLSREDEKTRESILKSELVNHPEFLASLQINVIFDPFPKGSVEFNAANQRAFDFRTYHDKHSMGILEVVDADIVGSFQRCAKLKCIGENDFRLSFLDGYPFPLKSLVAVDYQSDGPFEIFIAVKGQDGKLYFVHYLDGSGKEEEINDRGTIYAKIYKSGEENGPDMMRKELPFAEDLKRITGVDPVQMLSVIFSVTSQITIYRLLIR